MPADDTFRTSTVPGVTLGELIGRGGFALVYRARQHSLDRDVAVKIDSRRIDDERNQRRFMREARTASRVSTHPGVVSVYDAGITSDHHPYFVMELCEGGSFADRMRQGGMALPELLESGTKIAAALGAAHSAGVLHRDIKPANILIDAYGEPRLSDFGLAALVAPGEDLSVTLEAFTPAYSAPETFHYREPSARTDVWALGATLHAMFTGAAPRRAADGSPASIPEMLQRLEEPLAWPDLPGADLIMPVLRKATSPNPQDRFADGNEFRAALVDLARRLPYDGEPTSVRNSDLPSPIPGPNVPSGRIDMTSPPTLSLGQPGSQTVRMDPAGAVAMQNLAPPTSKARRAALDPQMSAPPAPMPGQGYPASPPVMAPGRAPGAAARHAMPSPPPSPPMRFSEPPGSAPEPVQQTEPKRRGSGALITVSSLVFAAVSVVLILLRVGVIPLPAGWGPASSPTTAAAHSQAPVTSDPPSSKTEETDAEEPDTEETEEPEPQGGAVPPLGTCYGPVTIGSDGWKKANRVPCDKPHHWELILVQDLISQPGTQQALESDALASLCNKAAVMNYVGGLAEGYELDRLSPRAWGGPSNKMACLAGYSQKTMVGSIKKGR